MRMSPIVVLLAAGAVAAAGVSPPTGTTGTELTIALDRSIASRPHVRLVLSEPPGTVYAVKVSSYTANEVRGVVGAVRPGTYDVEVREQNWRKIGYEFQPDAFSVEAPTAERLAPGSAEPGGAVTIEGLRFGTVKRVVRVGPRKGRVTSWTDDSVTFTVPLLKNGTYDVTLKNRVGKTRLAQSLTVENSPLSPPSPGMPSMTARIDGVTFTTVGGPLCLWNRTTDAVTVAGSTVPGGDEIYLSLGFVADLGESVLPLTLTADCTYNHTHLTEADGFHVDQYFCSAGPRLSVTLTRFDGERLEGIFSGSIARVAGSGPEVVQVTEGRFVAPVTEFD